MIGFCQESKLITIAKAAGYIQQLAGKYSKECVYKAEKVLNDQLSVEAKGGNQTKKDISVLKLIERVGTEIIFAESLPFYKEEIFFNMNDVEDYKFLLKRLNTTNIK